MNPTRTTITGAMAMLAVAAVITAVVALATPTSTLAEGDVAPTIKSIRDTGDSFVVRWTVPEGVSPQDQVVYYWTDNGYRWLTNSSHPVSDDKREYEIAVARSGLAGTAYGFRVEMSVDGATVSSRSEFRFPHGPMAKQRPSSLEAHWHDDELRLEWVPGRNPRYVKQIAKCRFQERGSAWERVELERHVNSVMLGDLDSSRKYVCRVEARKANGHYQMTNPAYANQEHVATPAGVGLRQVESGSDQIRFSWSMENTEDVSKILVQREGPLSNLWGIARQWETVAELGADATSYVDTVPFEDQVFYWYRVVVEAERGGSTVSRYGVCFLDQEGDTEYYTCGPSSAW